MKVDFLTHKVIGGVGIGSLLQTTLPANLPMDNPWFILVYIFLGGVGLELVRQISAYKTQKLKTAQEDTKDLNAVYREDLKDFAGMNKELREELDEATAQHIASQKDLLASLKDSHEKDLRIRELEMRLQTLESQRRSDRLEIGHALQSLGEELSEPQSTAPVERGRSRKSR